MRGLTFKYIFNVKGVLKCESEYEIITFKQSDSQFVSFDLIKSPEFRLSKSSQCSLYPEIDFDNVPQYWSSKVLPKWTKFEEIIHKSSIFLVNI